MKKLKCALASILICLTACLCGACSTEGESAPTVTQNTQTFVTIVAQIQEPVKVDDGSKIEVALLVYDYLNDAEKGNPDVAASKTRLDGLKSKYDVVKAEADRQAEIAREEKLVSDFISEVNGLPSKLKLSDRETIDALIETYARLKAESKRKSEVAVAYGKLTDADLKVLELEEAARAEEIKTTAENFVEAVQDALAAIDEAEAENRETVILSSRVALEKLLYDYADFDNDIKNYEGVAAAKEALDDVYAEYVILRDEADVKEFLELVKALKPVEEKVTLENETALTKAESAYRYMSDEAKGKASVAEAYAVLQQARERFDALFAAAEEIKIQQFIEAANKVGTDIKNVDIDWFEVLDAASRAYQALSYDSYDLPEVKEAFNRWNAAQKVFDKQGYEKIPMSDPSMIFSDDANLVLQKYADMFNAVADFYKVSSYTEISEYAILWLNVYVDGVYIAKGEMDLSKFINSGLIFNRNAVVEILMQLSNDNPEIVSGARYSFALNFEDKGNEYIPSSKSKITVNQVYTW